MPEHSIGGSLGGPGGAPSSLWRPRRRVRRAIDIGIPLLAFLAIIALWFGARQPATMPGDSAMLTLIPVGSVPVLGSHEAPVVIVAFSNLSCAFCLKFGREVWPLLKERWVEPGHVQVAFRHFSSSAELSADRLAHIAACAALQRQFWSLYRAVAMDEAGWAESAWRAHAADHGIRLDEHVAAQPYGNCADVSASWDWANITYCGPYGYGDPAPLGSLTSTASSYVQAYGWGSDVYLYWWGRVTPFDEPAYYDAGFQVVQ